MGTTPAFSEAMRSGSLSVQTTWWPSSAKHVPVTKPTYPQPITEIRTYGLLNCGLSTGLSTPHHLPAGSLQPSLSVPRQAPARTIGLHGNGGSQIEQSAT